jgi:hypothetical protein
MTVTLLEQGNEAVACELVRLLSALASDSGGRSYLLQPGSQVLPALFAFLKNTPQAKLTTRYDTTFYTVYSISCELASWHV